MTTHNRQRPILFAYDGSDQAKAAIRAAAAQLRPLSRAFVLTVWQPCAALLVASGARLLSDLEDSIEQEATTVAEEGAAPARSVGFNATPVVDRGVPVWRGASLISVAEEPPDGDEYFTVEPHADQPRSIARLADAGNLRPPSVEVVPLASAREAFARRLEPGRRGKVVLAVT